LSKNYYGSKLTIRKSLYQTRGKVLTTEAVEEEWSPDVWYRKRIWKKLTLLNNME